MCRCARSLACDGSTLVAGRWLREVEVGGVGLVGGHGLLALARRLGFGWRNESTATQQGAAPDRPQCCRFCSFSARLKVGLNWRAAGELSVVSLRPRGCAEAGSTLTADTWSREVKVGVVGVLAGAASWLWRGVWVSRAQPNQQQHNKILCRQGAATKGCCFFCCQLGSNFCRLLSTP